MKKLEFPKIVRVGQTKATIYRTPSHGSESFTVVWFEGAIRKRKAFSTFQAAELHASSMVNSLSRGESDILRLSGEDRLAFVRAREALAEFNLSLDSIAFEYRDAKRIAKGKSLVEVAEYFAQHKLRDIPEITVSKVLDEMLKAKRDEGLSELYLRDLKLRGGKFAKAFQCNLTSVLMNEIREWLQAMPVANRTRNNCRLAVQTLFAFAKSRKYLPSDWNEFDSIPLWKIKHKQVEIYTPEEFKILLTQAPNTLLPFLVIGAFAGLRTAEIERLYWSKINLESGFITVDASIAKTNSRRLIPIQPNLKLWLKCYAKSNGPVIELAGTSSAIYRFIEDSRLIDPQNPKLKLPPAVEWRRNALRHSFCSYRLAQIKNAAEVALEAGNSPKIIFQHYRELVAPQEAAKWFSIVPINKVGVDG
jgi:integrase